MGIQYDDNDDISLKGSDGTPIGNTGDKLKTTALTDAELRATAVPVSQASQPLPTGASTSTLQTTGNSSLSSIDTKTPTLGQKVMAASQPVVMASDQSPVRTTDISDSSGLQGAVTVGLTAVAIRVGGSNLANRKTLTAFHNGNQDIYWGYTNAVTVSSGSPIFKSQFAAWSIGPNTTVWMISGTAGQDVRVTENA